jgi:hypothetical protein
VVELDRYAANVILGRVGLVLKSKATASTRTVQTTLEPGKVWADSLFWLAKTTPAGILDPDDEADAAL